MQKARHQTGFFYCADRAPGAAGERGNQAAMALIAADRRDLWRAALFL
jgi:hypothetical protein